MTMKDTRKYKQTELGLLPEDWEVAKLGEKFRFISNNTFSRDFLCEDGEIKNIHYGDVLIKYGSTLDVSQSDIPAINTEILPSYQPKCFAEDGDIIIADTAEDETVCKATELWNIGGKQIVAGLHTMWCRPAQNTFAIRFLGYFMNTSLYHNQVLPLIQGIKVSSVSKSAIQGTWLCIPPIEEQRRIASALTSIDNLIDSLDRLIAKKRDIKQGAMQQLLSGKKRLKGFTEPWVEKKLGEILSLKNGFAFKSETYCAIGKYKIITIANVQNGRFDLTDYNSVTDIPASIQQHQKLSIGDILISMTGNVGRVCRVDSSNCLLNQRVGLLEIRPNVNSDFVFTALNTNAFENAMRDKGQGAAQANISKSDIEDYVLLMPSSLLEQQAIASVLTSMDNELSALEAKRKKYEQIKQGMMQQLLTGRIRLI